MNPASITGTIVLGAVSGIVTSTFFWVLAKIWRDAVNPWWERRKYSGLLIGGAWEGQGDSQRVTFVLNQSATDVEGTATFTAGEPSSHYEQLRQFSVTGTVRDRFVVLTFRHIDRSRIGVGAFVLEISGDGRRMSGCWSFFSVASDGITSSYIDLYRPEALPNNASPQLALELDDEAYDDDKHQADNDENENASGSELDQPKRLLAVEVAEQSASKSKAPQTSVTSPPDPLRESRAP